MLHKKNIFDATFISFTELFHVSVSETCNINTRHVEIGSNILKNRVIKHLLLLVVFVIEMADNNEVKADQLIVEAEKKLNTVGNILLGVFGG